MTFEDLPHGWPARSLADATLAVDVVDLFLKDSDRVRNSLLLLICDEEGRAVQPVIINDVDWFATAKEREGPFQLFAHVHVPGLVVAVSGARPLPPEVVERWRHTAVTQLDQLDIELLGFYTADRDGVWKPGSLAA